MCKRGLVAVSFGTSVPEARSSISAVEEALAAAAPERVFARAFTSPTIRRILRDRGEEIASLSEALERLAALGVRRVAVQPTHLLRGYEYDRLRSEAEALAGRFEALAVGRPLLADNGDIQRFARRLSREHPAEEGAATVFMGHGTGHFANAAYPALQTALAFLGREDIYIGTVEGWPGLEDIVRRLEPGGRRRIRLLPLMLVAGDHARNDMDGTWRARLERAGHAVSCSFTGLGESAWVREMYQERLREIL